MSWFFSCLFDCQDCGADNTLKPGDVIQCRECGYRILYKKRTRRSKMFKPFYTLKFLFLSFTSFTYCELSFVPLGIVPFCTVPSFLLSDIVRGGVCMSFLQLCNLKLAESNFLWRSTMLVYLLVSVHGNITDTCMHFSQWTLPSICT